MAGVCCFCSSPHPFIDKAAKLSSVEKSMCFMAILCYFDISSKKYNINSYAKKGHHSQDFKYNKQIVSSDAVH